MTVLYRMIPDVAKGGGVVTSRGTDGKKTSVLVNTTADLALEECYTLHGWINCGLVGTTAQRPSGTRTNEHYIDTTLSKVIFSDGRGGWHDPFTGGLV